MPQVESVVMQLDADGTGKQELSVVQLRNASPKSLAKVLQDAFQKNGSNSTRNSTTETDPLENRSTTQAQQGSANAAAANRGPGGGGVGQTGGFGGSAAGGR
jgi:hypothetical protein